MNGKLEDIGKRSGLTPDDIKQIRSSNRRWKIVSWLIGIMLVILAFIIGLFIGLLAGNEGSSNDGYPYAMPFFATVGSLKGRRNGIKTFIPMSIITFMFGLSAPVFGNGIRYGVFNRRQT